MHESNGKWDSSLLTATQVLNETILWWQIEKVEQEMETFDNLWSLHAENPSEVHHGLLDWKFSIKCDFLRHITDTFSWHSRSYKFNSLLENVIWILKEFTYLSFLACLLAQKFLPNLSAFCPQCKTRVWFYRILTLLKGHSCKSNHKIKKDSIVLMSCIQTRKL